MEPFQCEDRIKEKIFNAMTEIEINLRETIKILGDYNEDVRQRKLKSQEEADRRKNEQNETQGQ